MSTVVTPYPSRSAAGSIVRDVARRIPGMMAVWVGFGVLTGVSTAPGAGPIALAAGVIAGLIVLTPLGVVLAVVGGQWKGSLAGGLAGLTGVPVLGGVADVPAASLVPVALIFGGLVGATVVTAFYTLPRVVLAAVRGSAARRDESVTV
jgi:hypothetical protein